MKLSRLKKITDFLTYIGNAKKIWQPPKKSSVLIFDTCVHPVLVEYLQLWQPEFLHVRGESINIWVLFLSLFKPGKRVDAYIDTYIEMVRPKLLITLVDNNINFYSISLRHPDIKTFFIQNGIRVSEVFDNLEKISRTNTRYKVDYMATFGSCIGEMYQKCIDGEVFSIGSIVNNSIEKKSCEKIDTICFVSAFRNFKTVVRGERVFDAVEYFNPADKLVLNFLLNYSKENSKQLTIITCSNDPQSLNDEMSYYTSLVGEPLIFSNKNTKYASYNNIDSAEVVVSIESTLGYESIARGNKTAIFSIRSRMLNLSDRVFGWPCNYPDKGAFWTNNPDLEIFKQIIDYLFSITTEEWLLQLDGNNYAQILNFDPGNIILQNKINDILGY